MDTPTLWIPTLEWNQHLCLLLRQFLDLAVGVVQAMADGTKPVLWQWIMPITGTTPHYFLADDQGRHASITSLTILKRPQKRSNDRKGQSQYRKDAKQSSALSHQSSAFLRCLYHRAMDGLLK